MKQQNIRKYFNEASDKPSGKRDNRTNRDEKIIQTENSGILDFAKQMIKESKRAIQETNVRIEETKRLMK